MSDDIKVSVQHFMEILDEVTTVAAMLSGYVEDVPDDRCHREDIDRDALVQRADAAIERASQVLRLMQHD